MRIEELILEGFKSYPVRTQITGWDSSFNAITGLNGSGKSNILDAICFVLGLTNMTQMRAQNQQDLIYKRGQAGITKASVTIVFDNSDPETSPAGLQDLPQITVTRQIALPNISKYLLNGHKSQQQTIQSLFQSVQLNINNPNFLIMQGRITKVLNMRPQEILGMVEEAAGTRMFEERKDKAKKTMGKKEKRVEEITSLLREEITPKLDTLRNEKRSFLQWQKTCSELERVARTLRAYEWSNWSANIHKKDDEIKANAKATKETKSGQKQLLKEAQQAERDAEGVKKQREKELQKGGKYQKLEAEVKELDKALEKILAKRDIRTTTISEEEKKLSNLDNERNELEASLADKRFH
ncbi:condensin subunit [Amylostereum chailletii]|nr:condensin subunit [Amylostereum chailletii]